MEMTKKAIVGGIVVMLVMTVFAGMVCAQSPVNAIPPGQQCLGVRTTGDNPLTTSYSWIGMGDVVVDVVGFSMDNPYGTFAISGIPAGSTIVKAYMYAQEWDYVTGETASATLSGVPLTTVPPIANDLGGGLNLATYRWDVTSIVTGSGSYLFTTSGVTHSYGAVLVVVYSNPSEPSRQIIINDGAESLDSATSTTTFAGVQDAGAGELILFTEADNPGGTESVSFNGAVVAGPGDIFYGNQEDHASLLTIPITAAVVGNNTASVTTSGDWFGWELAIFVTEAQQSPSVSITTDRFEYSPGDTTIRCLEINNPTADPVTFNMYLGVPQFTYWGTIASAPIPAGFSYSGDLPFPVGDWGPTPFGMVWYVELTDGTGEVLDSDVATCAYSPGMAVSKTSDAVGAIEKSIRNAGQ